MELQKVYSLLVNVNESILLLNQYCNIHGFEIKFFDLYDIEKKFGALFGLKNVDRPRRMGIHSKTDKMISVSHEFMSNFKKNHIFSSYDYHKHSGFFFLIKNTSSRNVKLNNFEHFQFFDRHIISTLRLFKEGDIGTPFHFFKSDKNYNIGSSGYKGLGLYRFGDEYSIESDEIEDLINLLNLRLTSNELSEIATKFFTNCYHTHDYQIKLINSMIAFESLFNRGKDQLRHIISRHTAILISETKEEFDRIYLEMKKLYDLRSSLVHTGHISDKSLKPFGDTRSGAIKLMNYLRQVLLKCYQYNGNKNDLFEELNLKGMKN